MPLPHRTPSPGTIKYNTDLLRQVGAQILTNVSQAQQIHTHTWNTIQSYLDGDASYGFTFNGQISTMEGRMPDAYYYLRNVLEPHAKRLQATFDLQTSIAQALFDLADQIDETEQYIANGFRDPGPSPTVRKGNITLS